MTLHKFTTTLITSAVRYTVAGIVALVVLKLSRKG